MSKLQFNSQGFITGFKKMTKAPASPCRLRTKSSYLKGMLRKNWFEVVDEYMDDGYSGTNFRRRESNHSEFSGCLRMHNAEESILSL